jgi:hypothetical protein
MYDVLYLDSSSRSRILASGLERHSAARIARDEARRRQVCRMFTAGSAYVPRSDAVLVVDSPRRPL